MKTLKFILNCAIVLKSNVVFNCDPGSVSISGEVISNCWRKGFILKSVYLRFLAVTEVLYGASEVMGAIDLDAKRLLEIIAIQNERNARLTVSEAMQIQSLGSPATIHRKIDQLRIAGLIDMVFEGKNRRTKYLVQTDAANSYFDKVGKALTDLQPGT